MLSCKRRLFYYRSLKEWDEEKGHLPDEYIKHRGYLFPDSLLYSMGTFALYLIFQVLFEFARPFEAMIQKATAFFNRSIIAHHSVILQ